MCYSLVAFVVEIQEGARLLAILASYRVAACQEVAWGACLPGGHAPSFQVACQGLHDRRWGLSM